MHVLACVAEHEVRNLIWCVHHDVNEQEYADYEEKLEELEMRELKKEQDAMVQFRHTHTHKHREIFQSNRIPPHILQLVMQG